MVEPSSKWAEQNSNHLVSNGSVRVPVFGLNDLKSAEFGSKIVNCPSLIQKIVNLPSLVQKIVSRPNSVRDLLNSELLMPVQFMFSLEIQGSVLSRVVCN